MILICLVRKTRQLLIQDEINNSYLSADNLLKSQYSYRIFKKSVNFNLKKSQKNHLFTDVNWLYVNLFIQSNLRIACILYALCMHADMLVS